VIGHSSGLRYREVGVPLTPTLSVAKLKEGLMDIDRDDS